jgi:hypothetical protein
MNVEHEMYDYTGNHWGHRNSNKSLKKNLEVIPGKHSIHSLQKTAILETSHIIQKVLQFETGSLSGGNQEEQLQEEKACDKRKYNNNNNNNNNNNRMNVFSLTN